MEGFEKDVIGEHADFMQKKRHYLTGFSYRGTILDTQKYKWA